MQKESGEEKFTEDEKEIFLELMRLKLRDEKKYLSQIKKDKEQLRRQIPNKEGVGSWIRV